jgi:hypothetical protein
MEKQPNSRMCFVCGIENPIGLHLAFYTRDEGRRTVALYLLPWTSQLEFQCTLALCRYD